MHLYNMTLERSRAILHACVGNFTSSRESLIAVSNGSVVDLLSVDPSTGKLKTLSSTFAFGIIRSMISFRLTGSSKDYLVLGCDSGRIVILSCQQDYQLEIVHSETFGKSGCRRIVAGQYLSVDPRGRAVMVSAIEKHKLVYILNRDSQARLTISSPLEGHKSSTLVYSTVGVDVGFDNPIFACLEVDYSTQDTDQDTCMMMHLSFYELDLGLNHVVRKYSEALDCHANDLIAVPGGNDGPSGVLVCQEGSIVYKNFGDQPDLETNLPMESGSKSLVVCHAQHKTSRGFFFLIQNEDGDVFKLTLQVSNETVEGMTLVYLDTLPVANCLVILKSGFLLLCAEFGNHMLYQISSLDGEIVSTSQELLDVKRTSLKNFLVVDSIACLNPMLGYDTQVCTVGRGGQSSLRVLQNGLPVSELAVSQLPGCPLSVWSIKKSFSDSLDSYIVVSFSHATLVLSIVGSTVEEVSDSGFLGSTLTLSCCQIGEEDHVLQVYPSGIRDIKTSCKRVNEWRTPASKKIVQTAVNNKQVVIALTGGEIVYFEMTGQLNEYTDRKDMNGNVLCMALASVKPGEARTRFLAIALHDKTVRIVSLDPKDCLTPLSMQAFNCAAHSLVINSLKDKVYLNVGLENGLLLRTMIDSDSGDLSDTRIRYLGNRPVILNKLANESVIALSGSKSWLILQPRITPLDYQVPLVYASPFKSSQSEGVVAVDDSSLRILEIEEDKTTSRQVLQLESTPRRLVKTSQSGLYCLIESDYRSRNDRSYNNWKQDVAEDMVLKAMSDNKEEAALRAAAFLAKNDHSRRSMSQEWHSLVRLVNLERGVSLDTVSLESQETAVSLVSAKDKVIVGVAHKLVLTPHRSCDGGAVHVYSILNDKLSLLHVTLLEEVPHALCMLDDETMIAVSVASKLRVYEIGKKMLLKKNEVKSFPDVITCMQRKGSRLFVSTVSEGVFFLDLTDMTIFGEDSLPRYCTALAVVDYSTVCVGDKFGNLSLLRTSQVSSKLDVLCNWHVGETVTSLEKTCLVKGLETCLVYTTLSGSIGILVPLKSGEDQSFFEHLEMHLRQNKDTISGRDHLSYRSYYSPSKHVIDGDLCQQFVTLDSSKQKSIAEQMDRTVQDILNKLDDIRAQYAY